MYQQQTPQPRDEHSWSNPEAGYEEGYAGSVQQSDQLADAIARRLQTHAPSSLQMAPGVQFGHSFSRVSAGMRLALAIVSVVMLIPLSAIILSALGAFGGLIGLAIVSAVILGINFTFNAWK